LTPEQRQEELSPAYLHAVTAKCGFAIGNWSQDQSCIDATVGAAELLGGGNLADPKLDVQLKCTANQELVRDDHVALQISRKQYDRLVAKSFVPKILVVLVLPAHEAMWVAHSVEELILRRCAYFLRTTGLGPITAESKTVQVPLANIFSPSALEQMMGKLSRGEVL